MRGAFFWSRPLLMFLVIVAALATMPDSNCPDKCGNMIIPYPFGVGERCSRDGFNISCQPDPGRAGMYKAIIRNIEVTNISLVPAQVRVRTNIGFACYNSSGYPLPQDSRNTYMDLTDSPYRFSDTSNKLTAVGCRTLAYIRDPYASTQYYMSGCLSVCQDENSVTDGAPCNGIGCCQTSIPKGLQYYNATFAGFNHSRVWDFSPCSYAFLADQEWYVFNSSDVYKNELYYRNDKVAPVVLDWAIGNETCEQAKLNMTAYACTDENSYCVNSTNGPGYTCNCSSGFQGNPYISNGCQDIDECKDPQHYQCYGECINLQGSFNCSCPSGTHGNHTQVGGCLDSPGPQVSLSVRILIAGLCSFLVIAVMYVVYENAKMTRAKQKCFRQNGGLFFQQQIKAHQGVRFKIFSIEEMKRATKNFDEGRVKGRGGQGTVYEGILDDKRRAAVKKAVMIDEKKKEDFAKEIHILSLINHKNVIKILGCCLEVEAPMLVYEFISRGTLSQRIQNKNRSMPLGFRLKVAEDSASALAYLHSDVYPTIIHGDVKSSNILLDDEYVAKVSDFGASLFPVKDIIETGVAGTYGYLDPESLETGKLTEKSDVYSFAVVILELLTRKTAVYSEGPREKKSLAQTFEEKGLANIIDDEIKYAITKEQIDEFAELLTKCLKEKGEERPAMTKVVAWLRRMREFHQNQSEEHSRENIEPLNGDSSNRTTYIAEYYSSGHQAMFEIDSSLTR